MTDPRTIALLEADPDLAALCSAEQAEAARRAMIVRQYRLHPGPWDGERLRDAGPEHVGLLLIGGLIARELVLSDNVSAELLGPGDVVRPWQAESPDRLVPFDVRWTVLEPSWLAVLDRRFAATLAAFPAVNAMLVDRVAQRATRLAVMQAISQLNGVDRRLLTLFWHLAERWGHMTPGGVSVPITLPHRLVAQLVGARRPTVSTALGALAERGELIRRPDGAWLLPGAPVGVPTESAARIIRRRRRHAPMPGPAADEPPRSGRLGELHETLAALRAENARSRARFDALRGETAELVEELAANRARLTANRPRPGPAA